MTNDIKQRVDETQEYMLDNYVVKTDVLDYVVPALIAIQAGAPKLAEKELLDFLELICPNRDLRDLMTEYKR